MFETFDHTADLGIRVRAGSLDEMFADGGRALMSVLVDDPAAGDAGRAETVELDGALPDLFFDWLSELLYLFSVRRFVAREFEVAGGPASVRATLRGWTFDPDRHAGAREVKAITYHDLEARRDGAGWFAQFILDI